MKKLILLSIICISFIGSYAQDQRDQARRRVLGHPANNARTYQTTRTTVHTTTYSNHPRYSYNNNNNRNYYNRRRNNWRSHYHYRYDNGRHLGWEKGRGNPHRNEGHEDHHD